MDLIKNLRTKPPTYEDAVAAASEIEFWRNRTKSEEIQVKYWNERANKRSEIILEQQAEIERLREALNEAHHQLNYWQKMALLTNSESAALQQKESE